MKKTANVKQILEFANYQLTRTDEYATRDFKAGIALMIEEVLFMTDQYNGYIHIGGHKVEDADYYVRHYHMRKK